MLPRKLDDEKSSTRDYSSGSTCVARWSGVVIAENANLAGREKTELEKRGLANRPLFQDEGITIGTT
ncbi:hypothetical protein TNCV_4279201 [Trichonephila clavipes]|nr:hypothetical protein TNCV_4279201 [Trichonephila clavipes]